MVNITSTWYLTANPGAVPARICPVIMPGKLTIPAAAIALIIGIMPERMASRRKSLIASCQR